MTPQTPLSLGGLLAVLNGSALTGRHVRRLGSLLLLVVFVAAIELWFGWQALLAPWGQMDPGALLAAMLLVLVSYGLRAVRTYDYFLPLTRGAFGACWRLTLVHNALNNFLPMRTGEISFPVLLRRYFAIPAVRAVTTLVWFRLLDAHTLAAVALLALGLGRAPVATLLVTLLWLTLPWWLFRVQAGGSRRLLASIPARWRPHLEQAVAGFPRSESTFWRCWAWTLGSWLSKLAVFAWLLKAFADLAYGPAWLGAIGGEVAGGLPSLAAGAGTYEAGVVAALLPFGVSLQAAFQAAVNLHLFLLGFSLLCGTLALILGKAHVAR